MCCTDGTRIHPTAIVDSKAELGENVKIGAYAIIDGGAKIGDGTIIEPFAHIYGLTEIGRDCHIFEYTVVGGIPQDHDYKEGETAYARIGDGVILRENVTVHRATGEGCETVIGSGSMLMESCHVAHNVRIGSHCTVTNKVGFSGHVEIGDYAVIGGITGFHQFVRVGCYAMVGGMAKIIKDIPPYSLGDGIPARIYGLNTLGLRRRGFTQDERTHIKRIYKLFYDRSASQKDAVDAIERVFPNDRHARTIVEFVNSSKRGLTPWAYSDIRTRGGVD